MKLEQPSELSRTMAFRSGAATSWNMAETSSSTVITAQIPAVPPAHSYGVLLPDGSIWYPGSKKRLPAPLPLRIAVWALAFLVLLAAAGDFVIRDHPGWVDPFRRMVPTAAGSLNVNTSLPTGHHHHAASSATGTAPSGRLRPMSPQPAGLPQYTTAYDLGSATSYQVTVHATQTTWVIAYHLVNGADSGTPIFARDVQPGQPGSFSASGPVDLETAASGATVSVVSGGHALGTVSAPNSAPWHFYLEPNGTK